MLRELLFASIAAVERGDDPQGLVREADRNVSIDLEGWIAERGEEFARAADGVGVPRRTRAQVFDERHLVQEVPYGAARPRGTAAAGQERSSR